MPTVGSVLVALAVSPEVSARRISAGMRSTARGQASAARGAQQVVEQQHDGQWGPQISTMFDDVNNTVQCLEYDSLYERLWVGHKNGRVMSLAYKEDEQTLAIDVERYSSFIS